MKIPLRSVPSLCITVHCRLVVILVNYMLCSNYNTLHIVPFLQSSGEYYRKQTKQVKSKQLKLPPTNFKYMTVRM